MTKWLKMIEKMNQQKIIISVVAVAVALVVVLNFDMIFRDVHGETNESNRIIKYC